MGTMKGGVKTKHVVLTESPTRSELLDIIKALSAQLRGLESELEAAGESLASLNDLQAQLQITEKQLAETVTEGAAAIEMSAGVIAAHVAVSEDLRAQASDLKTRLQSALSDRDGKLDINATLRAQLASGLEALAAVTVKFDEAEAERVGLRGQVMTLAVENADQAAEIARLQAEAAAKDAAFSAQAAEMAALRDSLAAVTSERDAARTEVQRLNSDLRGMERELFDLGDQFTALQADFDRQLKASDGSIQALTDAFSEADAKLESTARLISQLADRLSATEFAESAALLVAQGAKEELARVTQVRDQALVAVRRPLVEAMTDALGIVSRDLPSLPRLKAGSVAARRAQQAVMRDHVKDLSAAANVVTTMFAGIPRVLLTDRMQAALKASRQLDGQVRHFHSSANQKAGSATNRRHATGKGRGGSGDIRVHKHEAAVFATTLSAAKATLEATLEAAV